MKYSKTPLASCWTAKTKPVKILEEKMADWEQRTARARHSVEWLFPIGLFLFVLLSVYSFFFSFEEDPNRRTATAHSRWLNEPGTNTKSFSSYFRRIVEAYFDSVNLDDLPRVNMQGTPNKIRSHLVRKITKDTQEREKDSSTIINIHNRVGSKFLLWNSASKAKRRKTKSPENTTVIRSENK